MGRQKFGPKGRAHQVFFPNEYEGRMCMASRYHFCPILFMQMTVTMVVTVIGYNMNHKSNLAEGYRR